MTECSSHDNSKNKTNAEHIHHSITLQNKSIDKHENNLLQILMPQRTTKSYLEELGSMMYSMDQKCGVLLPNSKLTSVTNSTWISSCS